MDATAKKKEENKFGAKARPESADFSKLGSPRCVLHTRTHGHAVGCVRTRVCECRLDERERESFVGETGRRDSASKNSPTRIPREKSLFLR